MEDLDLINKNQTDPILNDPAYVTFISLLALFLTVLLWWCFSQYRQIRRSILFVGLAQAGKTLIFVRLMYKHYRQTFTSMKENIDEYTTARKTWRIVDLPGQERIRLRYFDQYKKNARGIVFVVDSVTIMADVKEVADFLYTILLEPVIRNNSIPVLVLCNKQDLPMAVDVDTIKELLEEEMQLVRITKVNQLGVLGPSQSIYSAYLGRRYENFKFSHLNCKLDIAESSANTGRDDVPSNLAELDAWMAEL